MIPYQAMVAAVRREIPNDVRFVAGVVTELKTSEDLQEVRLSDGRVVEARLIILATGLNGNLVENLGIGHSYVHKGHTLCVGFTVAPIAQGYFRFYGADILRCGGDGQDRLRQLLPYVRSDARQSFLVPQSSRRMVAQDCVMRRARPCLRHCLNFRGSSASSRSSTR